MAAGLIATALAGSAALAARPSNDTPGVPTANPKVTGMVTPNRLTARLLGKTVINRDLARGSMATENSMPTANGFFIQQYGYVSNGPNAPALNSNVESTKTEPDKNTYLQLSNQHGADPNYDYGTNFLYQGHELGVSLAGIGRGSLTRINLDADAQHRVTVLATQDNLGNFLPVFDGSVWNPFANVLLLSFEGGTNGGIWQATADYPSVVTDMAGVFGRGGYEGMQLDPDGTVWIVEDVGGPTGVVNNFARQPNSFIYRLVPNVPSNLSMGGTLQALQVISLRTNTPIVFHPGQADADILSLDMQNLHTYGLVFDTHWVTIHDTNIDGFAPFSANAAAKAHAATPFKRPENGMFRPDDKFRNFFFTETGDTNAQTQAGSAYGGFGGVMQLTQNHPRDNNGSLALFFQGQVAYTAFDNLAFLTKDQLLVVEDAGDLLHGQRNALDSMYMFDVDVDYGAPNTPLPVRIMAEGRDASATLDSGLLGSTGFQNEGDNEITGMHVSNGSPTINGLLGTKKPKPFDGSWRIFWTQQHGENVTYEIIDLD